MDGLLTAVKTINRDSESPLVAVEAQTRNDAFVKPAVDLSQDISYQQLGQILKSRPGNDELAAALAALDPFNKSRKIDELDIRIPGPTTAQILQILVSTTIPDHWASLNGKDSKAKDAKCRAALLRCLSSIAGIGSLVAQLRTLIASSRAAAHQAEGSNKHLMIQDLLSVLAALLEPKDFLSRIYTDIVSLPENRIRQQAAWREFVSLVATGKILSTAAEALTVANASEPLSSVSWIGDGPRYATWLGGIIAHLASKIKVDEVNDWTSLAFLTGRALSLGYADQLVREIASELLFEQPSYAQFGLLVDHLRQPEQVAVLEAIFRDVQKKYFSDDLSESFKQSDAANSVISGVAALCKIVIADRPFLKDQILGWLSKSQGGSIQTVGLRRALLATYNDSTANAQIILLAAGQLNRLDPLQVHGIGRTGVFLNAVSNRLAASSNRARFLGMIVGTGISQLIEEPGKAMKFDLDEMQSEEALWYLSLTTVHDKVGPVESIKTLQKASSSTQQPIKSTQPNRNQKPSARSNRPQTSKIVAIEEIDDSEEEPEEDDDLLPYEKPDEDAEDEDEDPTLIQRNKPSAPVYIRDLISYLRDTENVERYHLAISTAPSLIRRKTGFGTELAEQVEELALTLVSLQNDNNHPSFHESRLQSMIALIVSQPLKMGRWFTAIFFDGDLSQVQRSAVLTALGLSAREIAGNGEGDAKALSLPTLGDTSFPSKRLSPALEAVFMGANESPIATLTREMSRTSLQPLAADAADRMAGPNALKVRTFSSRMEVEKKRQQREAQRQKNVVKDVHKVLAEGFFYPLQGRFEIMMLQFASPSLPGFTHETLSLLLSLHTAPISSEPTVTAALLSLFLAVVDVNIASGSNGEERLVTEHATRVMELREWASEIFDRMPSGSSKADSGPFADPQEQVRTLAAGIMVRLGEVIERYQGRLMGVNAGFKY
ncbi:DNA replication checkpoint protein tel2 [Penicillium subrubescens]|uniref:DNA replication checkpoint protein tel2 n=1 Tax=Penicillium subrubescens TaxID=1316194 RepID=A0A1Q5UKI1_9EURO|nr:DNA replication checkpoint protein tel2 [Penicillium subrubescens]